MNPDKTYPEGGGAFPSDQSASNWPGMTLRDYFAAASINGLVSWDPIKNGKPEDDVREAAFIAERAYLIADAMLAAREDKR